MIEWNKVGWPAMARLGMALVCTLVLTGCGPKQLQVPETTAMPVVNDDARTERFRQALEDDGIALSDTEMRALLSEGEIDRGLTPEEMREVQIYFKHYIHVARPVVERFMLRSQPYMASTRKVFRDRGLPEDLACLAFVESGFNPVAVSPSNAVGMWQFMASTGRQYGLTQDWWMDERRDPYRSTRAAADYLAKLYGDFQNWHLAVAAYNAGEGKIGRALAGTQTETFFELCRNNCLLDNKQQLKEETRQYVPRFLAMCKIMRNAQALGFRPADPLVDPKAADIPKLTPAVAVQASPGTDLAALAKGLGMRWDEFENYNPAFRRYITPPDRYVSVYVPQYSERTASALIRDGKLSGDGWSTYKVAKGDTMGKVSKRTGVPVTVLRQLNKTSEPLKAGTRLRIPARAGSTIVAEAEPPAPTRKDVFTPVKANTPARPATRSTKAPRSAPVAVAPARNTATSSVAKRTEQRVQSKSHTVDSGDTLASISRQYGISLADLRKQNSHLDDPDSLRIGQQVNLPSGAVRVASTSNPASKSSVTSSWSSKKEDSKSTKASRYEVQPGDTMWGIARKFSIPPDELLSLNNMTRSGTLKPGDFIRVAGN